MTSIGQAALLVDACPPLPRPRERRRPSNVTVHREKTRGLRHRASSKHSLRAVSAMAPWCLLKECSHDEARKGFQGYPRLQNYRPAGIEHASGVPVLSSGSNHCAEINANEEMHRQRRCISRTKSRQGTGHGRVFSHPTFTAATAAKHVS